MIIADLISAEVGGERLGRVYLASAPSPGDVIRAAKGEFMVIRRLFIDLGSDPRNGTPDNRLSVELKVRPV
jgi:hypothetical protein